MATFPYGRLQSLHESVHILDGAWRKSPMGRRMTAIQGPDGQVALHSAIELQDVDLGILEGLGRVSLILVPNKFHGSDASFYADRYPEAKVLVPRQIEASMREKLSRVDGTIEDGLEAASSPWSETIVAYPLAGTRLGEVLIYHPQSRTLIATDIVFHYRREDFRGVARLLMRLNGALDNFGPTRLAKGVFISDREAFRESMRPVLALDTERVIMSHGRVVESGGAQMMRAAFT